MFLFGVKKKVLALLMSKFLCLLLSIPNLFNAHYGLKFEHPILPVKGIIDTAAGVFTPQ